MQMLLPRRAAAAVATLAIAIATPALAQDWPVKPIRIVVTFAPGGSSDVVARAIAIPLQAKLGQPVVVENKPGAGGSIGAGDVARAAPDGYTLLMSNTTPISLAPAMLDPAPYDPIKSFAHVSLVATVPDVVMVHPSVPVKTVPELVTWIKAKGETINFGSGGIGSIGHILGETFKAVTKTDIVFDAPTTQGGSGGPVLNKNGRVIAVAHDAALNPQEQSDLEFFGVALDWLSAGKYAFGIGARNVDDAMMQGLPLNQFSPASLKEGSSVTAYNGTLSYFSRAPHPNAAKVAANWLLSREGQTAWLDYNHKTGGLYDSLREDISKEKVSARARRVKGAKFLWLNPAWIEDLDAIRDIIKKGLASSGKAK